MRGDRAQHLPGARPGLRRARAARAGVGHARQDAGHRGRLEPGGGARQRQAGPALPAGGVQRVSAGVLQVTTVSCKAIVSSGVTY